MTDGAVDVGSKREWDGDWYLVMASPSRPDWGLWVPFAVIEADQATAFSLATDLEMAANAECRLVSELAIDCKGVPGCEQHDARAEATIDCIARGETPIDWRGDIGKREVDRCVGTPPLWSDFEPGIDHLRDLLARMVAMSESEPTGRPVPQSVNGSNEYLQVGPGYPAALEARPPLEQLYWPTRGFAAATNGDGKEKKGLHSNKLGGARKIGKLKDWRQLRDGSYEHNLVEIIREYHWSAARLKSKAMELGHQWPADAAN